MNVATRELDALVRRELSNPHSVLGAHQDDGRAMVCALRLAASAVTAQLADGTSLELEEIHPGGVFEGFVEGAKEPLRYRLDVDYGDGGSFTIEDPYAFVLHHVGPQPLPELLLASLADQVQVQVADRRPERVRVLDREAAAVAVVHVQPVAQRLLRALHEALDTPPGWISSSSRLVPSASWAVTALAAGRSARTITPPSSWCAPSTECGFECSRRTSASSSRVRHVHSVSSSRPIPPPE